MQHVIVIGRTASVEIGKCKNSDANDQTQQRTNDGRLKWPVGHKDKHA